MNRGVALARRLRNHLHARIENLFASEQQFCLAATEKRRKEPAEVDIHRVERLLQQLA